MFQYILFDLDGTLTDSKPGILNCIRYALDYMQYTDYNDAFLNQFVGPPLMVSFQQFCGFSEEQATIATNKYRERFATIGIFENAAYEGAVSMLKNLKSAGKTIALATSKPEEYTLRIIERYGLAPYIDEPVGATMDGSREKKPDVIREALQRLNLTTPEQFAQTVMIGDRFYDIEGAKECNLASIGCNWGYSDPLELEQAGATYIADNIPQLTTLLLGNEKNS